MRVRKLYVFLLLPWFFAVPTGWLSAQVYQDFGLYAKFNTAITHNNTKVSAARGDTEHKNTAFGANFDTYFLYSLFYNAFYLSFAPQFKMQNSEPQVLLKELLLSYSFDAVEISLGKAGETRYLTSGRDYLTVRNRPVPFVDEFSFWKLSMYLPLEYVTFELGSKLVRTEYQYEWVGFDKAFSKNYLYVDFDYSGFSSHVGYAYTYELAQKNHAHDITGKVLYNYEDIIGGYFANLIAFEQGKMFSLKDYSYTLGLDFSFTKAFGNKNANVDVKLNTELIYEQEKHSIAPRVIFYYDELSVFTLFSYTFDVGTIQNTTSVQYNLGVVTFRMFNTFLYVTHDAAYYKRENSINTFGLEVVYEL